MKQYNDIVMSFASSMVQTVGQNQRQTNFFLPIVVDSRNQYYHYWGTSCLRFSWHLWLCMAQITDWLETPCAEDSVFMWVETSTPV